MRSAALRLATLLALAGLALAAQAEPARIAVQVDKPGVKVSPTLYGIFFEEINRAGDGGLYAEMIENRSFEDSAYAALSSGRRPNRSEIREGEVYAWLVSGGRMTLDSSKPLNANNPTALRLATQGYATLLNSGFRGAGLNVVTSATYDLSLYARSDGFKGALTARLISRHGRTLAERKIEGLGPQWKKFEFPLAAKAGATSASLALIAEGQGSICFDMVSLFPRDTWKGRKNGLRKDLAEKVAAMRPAFVRFPGGCFVEGNQMKYATRWKKTIGPVEERPGHWNLWGYNSTDGLGFHEFLQMCEDLKAEPLFVINCGMAHQDSVPMEQMGEMVQDALDAIEYCNGPVESKWGAARAAAGHPAPFNLKLMEIGNENGGPLYAERYPLFVKAIKAKYPQMQLICNVWRGNDAFYAGADIVDEHYYNTPDFFMKNATKYDAYDRKGPKVYVGEYAVTRGCGQGNLVAALGEAAFMTGMERNADHVVMASYAPLFVNVGWRQWNPDAIVYDQARSFGTPSYHVQAMFGANVADVVLPAKVEAPLTQLVKNFPGRVGIGTWNTQAEFKDIVVTGKDGKVLFQRDSYGPRFLARPNLPGKWSVVDGALRQSGEDQPARLLIGQPDWADYTLTLKARKLGGAEGFLISFSVQKDNDKNWWNIGGWGNKRHGLEIGGVEAETPGRIETGKWYDIKVEAIGARVRCWLDGKLIHDVSRAPMPSIYATAGLKNATGEVILKVVNAAGEAQAAELDLAGAGALAPTGQALVLTSASLDDENSFEAPEKVAPRAMQVNGVSDKFNYTFAANSVTVLRLKRAK